MDIEFDAGDASAPAQSGCRRRTSSRTRTARPRRQLHCRNEAFTSISVDAYSGNFTVQAVSLCFPGDAGEMSEDLADEAGQP